LTAPKLSDEVRHVTSQSRKVFAPWYCRLSGIRGFHSTAPLAAPTRSGEGEPVRSPAFRRNKPRHSHESTNQNSTSQTCRAEASPRIADPIPMPQESHCQELPPGAPVKRTSTRVQVPPVQLDGSAPKTMPSRACGTPRGGVGSRHGIEPAGRNEHMNHINEPRKITSGSRAFQEVAKAAEPAPRPTVAGVGNGPAGSAWATCREVTLG